MKILQLSARVCAATTVIFAFTVGWTGNSLGDDECTINERQDILNCALKNHPDIIGLNYEGLRDRKLVDIAKQRPNPEVESRLLGGKSADDTSFNTETTLLTTWELGGKRKARINQATALGQKPIVNIRETKESVALQTILALYRLRQIRTELAQLDEAIATFNRIQKAFKARPKLAPEQEVSLASFDLAREDYKLQKTSLIQEQSNLKYFLELATGVSFSAMQKYLPPFKAKWPHPETNADVANLDNATIAGAKLDQTIAQTEINVARSKAWPDLKIGPTLDTESLTSSTKVIGGVGFSIPLPILNRNKGEKAFAEADKLRADNNFELTVRKTSIERQTQLQRYSAAVRALKQSPPIGQLSGKHENIENLYEKGLVPSTLVIEAHRQLIDIVKTRNEQELTGIDALWRIYILDGSLMEARL